MQPVSSVETFTVLPCPSCPQTFDTCTCHQWGLGTSHAPSSPEVTTHILSAFLVCGLGILVCDSFCWFFSESLRGLSWSSCSEAALSTLLQSGRRGRTVPHPVDTGLLLVWAESRGGYTCVQLCWTHTRCRTCRALASLNQSEISLFLCSLKKLVDR